MKYRGFTKVQKSDDGKYIFIGDYVKGYPYSSPLFILGEDVRYNKCDHTVCVRAVLPGGPQGYNIYNIPKKIKTLDKLLIYLQDEHKFILR